MKSVDEIRSVIKQHQTLLSERYGVEVVGLFGSYAREEPKEKSDIDLLVLLAPPFDYFAELRQLVDLLYPAQLESEQLISAKPALASDYELGSISLYRNARREGVTV